MLKLNKSLVLSVAALVVFVGMAQTAKAGERENVEKIGASLCRAVRYMSGEPILDTYSSTGNTLTMRIYFFGVLTGLKYTADITIYFESGSARISSISYSDNAPTAHDPVYVEKWKRETNAKLR